MLNVLLKMMAPLVLLFSLLLLTGAAPLSAELYGQTEPRPTCCAQDQETPLPTTEGGACAAPDCRCLSCSLPVLDQNVIALTGGADGQLRSWLARQLVPSSPVDSIDYPPEHA